MTIFLLILFLTFQISFQPALHAEVQHESLAPQGDFVPAESDFDRVRSAMKGYNFESALRETRRLIGRRKQTEITEKAAYLLGDIYLAMAERKRPLLYKKSINAYRNARIRYPKSQLALPTLMKMGMIYAKNALYYEALASFDRILKKHPLSEFALPAQVNKGDTYLKWGKLDRAIKEFDKINPASLSKKDRIFLLLNYAEAYYSFDEYETAYQYYTIITPQNRILQASQRALFQYGISAYFTLNYKESREVLFILHNKYPREDHALLALARIGDTFRLQGKSDRAKKIYAQVSAAKQKSPSDKSAALLAALGDLHRLGCDLSRCYEGQALKSAEGRQALKVIKALSRQILKKADLSLFTEKLIFETATRLMKHGILSHALKIENALSKRKLNARFKGKLKFSIGKLAIASVNELMEEGQDMHALGVFYQYHNEFTGKILRGITGLHLGIAFYKVGFYQDAVKMLYPIAQKTQSPLHKEADFYLIETYFEENEDEKAEKQIKKFIARYPKSHEAAQLRLRSADMSFRQGDTVLAIKKYNRWLMRYKKNAKRNQVLILLGDAYIKVKNFKQARMVYLKAEPKNKAPIPGLHIKIADAFYRTKNYKKSITYYLKAILDAGDIEGLEWAHFQLAQSFERLGMDKKGDPVYARLEKEAADPFIQFIAGQKRILAEEHKKEPEN